VRRHQQRARRGNRKNDNCLDLQQRLTEKIRRLEFAPVQAIKRGEGLHMLALLAICVGDLRCRRFYRFASIPHRWAAAVLVGMPVSSRFTYRTALVSPRARRDQTNHRKS